MKFVVAVLAGALGATSALAADLPVRTYTKAPVMVDPGYNWSGFYIGGNIGYSWGRSSDTSSFTNGAGTTLFTNVDSTNLDGIVGGAQAGYNWQVQNWVWGLEGDIQGTGERGTRDFTCPTGVCTASTLAPGFLALAFLIPGSAVPVSMEEDRLVRNGSWPGRHFDHTAGSVVRHRRSGLWRRQHQRDHRYHYRLFQHRRQSGLHRRRRHRRRDRRQLDGEARVPLCRSRPGLRIVRNADTGSRSRGASGNLTSFYSSHIKTMCCGSA